MSELLSKLLPIRFENGVAKIDVSKHVKLTSKQLATFKATLVTYGQYHADRYLYNLMGLEKGAVNVARLTRNGLDKLSNKRSGSVLKQFRQLLNCEHDATHNPTERNVGHWIGVEIECIIPKQSDIESEYEDEDEREQAHRRWLRDQIYGISRCSVKSDGSLYDRDGIGVEITVLINTADGYAPLNRICRVLKDAGCYVNPSCGLHVHLDARHCSKKDVKIIGNRRLGRALNILKYMVPKSRTSVDDAYNKPGVSELTKNKKKRYRWINLTSWFEFKTIEVRLYHGTIDATKIINWIELLRFLAINKVPRNFRSFQDLIDLGTPEYLVEYADKQISTHNPEAWKKLNDNKMFDDIVIVAPNTQELLDEHSLTIDDVFPERDDSDEFPIVDDVIGG